MNKKPYLQIALDSLSYEDAFRSLGNGLDNVVDIVEVGTTFLLMEGLRAVDIFRTIYPNKILVADFKCIAAHFGSEILKKNPDLLTVLSAAEPLVPKMISEEALKRGQGQEVQIELYGDKWTWDDVQEWKEMGIKHIVYSRSRLEKGPWNIENVSAMQRLCDSGWEVTATGGVTYDDLEILAGLPLFAIICGRSVRNAENPAAEALRIKEKINQLWN